MAVIRLQRSEFIDQIVDGHEMTKLPYPFFVEEDGTVQGQDFWKGDPQKVLGFQKDLAVQQIDLWWEDAVRNPKDAVGMYAVTMDAEGAIGVHIQAIDDVTVLNG